MGEEQFDRDTMINAIWEAEGNVTAAARTLGISARTIHRYAAQYKTVQAAIDGARSLWDNKLLDIAELALIKQASEGRAWAVKYALDRKGKPRGYVESKEIDANVTIHAPTIFLPAVEEDAGE